MKTRIQNFFVWLFRLKRNVTFHYSDRDEIFDKHGNKRVCYWDNMGPFNILPAQVRKRFIDEMPSPDGPDTVINPLSDAAPGSREVTGVHFNDDPFGGKGKSLKPNR
jgi:hypothetical protein